MDSCTPSFEGNNSDRLSEVEIERLLQELKAVVKRIIESMERSGLLHGDTLDDLLDRTIRYLKAVARSLTRRETEQLSAKAMRAFFALQAVRVLTPEPNAAFPGQKLLRNPELAKETGYTAKVHYQPKHQVGGDLVCVRTDANDNVWVLLADVMGKSVAAHLTAASLEVLWEIGEERFSGNPLESLHWLEREMAEYMPGERVVFIETVVGCANSQGIIRIAAAGYVQYLTGNVATRNVEVVKFGGMYLGRGLPELFSVRDETVALNNEIVFATDGVFDQRTADGQLRNTLRKELANLTNVSSLHDAVIHVVSESLRSHEQDDDISVVSLHRLGSAPESVPT